MMTQRMKMVSIALMIEGWFGVVDYVQMKMLDEFFGAWEGVLGDSG
jgi:hypothetical protein